MTRQCLFLTLVLAWGLPTPALAGDGRTEISQTSVAAAGGFPFTIAASGSYMLTSDLVVTSDTTALVLDADGVHLDLNGFAVLGSSSCNQSSCTTGPATGITRGSGGNRVTVRNGRVEGFSGQCVLLGDEARVEAVSASECGGDGIAVGARSLVLHSIVTETGLRGIQLGSQSALAHNTIALANLSGSFPGTDFPAVEGGRATVGNLCDDNTCGPRRRFYLTTDTYDGSLAPTACAMGYHMASMWEILNPTELDYDTIRGRTTGDSGSGPPSHNGVATRGWIRTGMDPGGATLSSPGGISCNGYTTTFGSGTTVGLQKAWEAGWNSTTDSRIPWWYVNADACTGSRPVWCVSD